MNRQLEMQLGDMHEQMLKAWLDERARLWKAYYTLQSRYRVQKDLGNTYRLPALARELENARIAALRFQRTAQVV